MISLTIFTTGKFMPTSIALNLENPFTLVIVMVGIIIAALPFAFHFGIFT